MKVKMPSCYIMIESLDIPEEYEYISIKSNEEAIERLNIPIKDKVIIEKNENNDEEEKVDLKEEDKIYTKEKEIRKSLIYNLKSKVIR